VGGGGDGLGGGGDGKGVRLLPKRKPAVVLLPDVLTCCPRPGFYGILSTSTMNSVKTKKMGPKIYTNHGKMRENGLRFLSVFVVVTVKFP